MADTMLSAMAEAAQGYAARDWLVFPLRDGGKVPRTDHGVKDASADADVIARWWTQWPRANLGFAVPDGMVVLDLDVKNGQDGISELQALAAQHGGLPETRMAETPTGGRHLFFTRPADLRIKNSVGLRPGIDVRTAGGYVVLAPSSIGATPYRWLNDIPAVAAPPWLLDLLTQRNAPAPVTAPAAAPRDTDRYARRAFDSAIAEVTTAGEGNRNDTLNRQAYGLAGIAKAGRLSWPQVEAVLLRAAQAAGLPEAEARKTLQSAYGNAEANYSGIPSSRAAVHEGARGSNDRQPSDQGEAPALPLGTEWWLAEQFVEAAAGGYRWTPGMDWMTDVGDHWQRDLLLTRYSTAKQVCAAAAESASAKRAATILKASTSHALLNLARTHSAVSTPAAQWDAEPMLLNTPGGVVDLATGSAVNRAGLLFTQITAVAPQARPIPRWSAFLADVFDGDVGMIEFLQRLVGYTLTGSTSEQKLFFLHGIGANGKSVFIDTIRSIAGSYAHNLPTDALMSRRHEGHPTIYADLQGKRLAISGEVEESARWAEAKIKQLTGDETITARFMRQDFFTFRLTHKHVIAGNFKPRLKGDDAAMARRLVLVPFLQRFEGDRRDTDLLAKLRSEHAGILHWAVQGAAKWARDGLAIPATVANASRDYMTEQNDLLQWLNDCCTIAPGLVASVADAYASFRCWKESNGEHAPAKRAFSDRLGRMFERRRTKTARMFEGFELIAGDGELYA